MHKYIKVFSTVELFYNIMVCDSIVLVCQIQLGMCLLELPFLELDLLSAVEAGHFSGFHCETLEPNLQNIKIQNTNMY